MNKILIVILFLFLINTSVIYSNEVLGSELEENNNERQIILPQDRKEVHLDLNQELEKTIVEDQPKEIPSEITGFSGFVAFGSSVIGIIVFVFIFIFIVNIYLSLKKKK
jgi:hypothetical protein